jgi:hypothetical protein
MNTTELMHRMQKDNPMLLLCKLRATTTWYGGRRFISTEANIPCNFSFKDVVKWVEGSGVLGQMEVIQGKLKELNDEGNEALRNANFFARYIGIYVARFLSSCCCCHRSNINKMDPQPTQIPSKHKGRIEFNTGSAVLKAVNSTHSFFAKGTLRGSKTNEQCDDLVLFINNPECNGKLANLQALFNCKNSYGIEKAIELLLKSELAGKLQALIDLEIEIDCSKMKELVMQYNSATDKELAFAQILKNEVESQMPNKTESCILPYARIKEYIDGIKLDILVSHNSDRYSYIRKLYLSLNGKANIIHLLFIDNVWSSKLQDLVLREGQDKQNSYIFKMIDEIDNQLVNLVKQFQARTNIDNLEEYVKQISGVHPKEFLEKDDRAPASRLSKLTAGISRRGTFKSALIVKISEKVQLKLEALKMELTIAEKYNVLADLYYGVDGIEKDAREIAFERLLNWENAAERTALHEYIKSECSKTPEDEALKEMNAAINLNQRSHFSSTRKSTLRAPLSGTVLPSIQESANRSAEVSDTVLPSETAALS